MMKYNIISILLLFALVLSGCTGDSQTSTQTVGDGPITVSSEAELISLIQNSQNSYGRFDGAVIRNGLVQESMAVGTVDMQSPDSDFSQTNVQEAGIDEADIIKTDGEYIYTYSDNTLFIIQKEGSIVFEQDLNYTPTGLFIQEEVLFVIGNSYGDIGAFNNMEISVPYTNTYIEQFDVSTPQNTELVTSTVAEGNFFQARMVNDVVYVLTQTNPVISRPIPVFATDGLATQMPMERMYYFPGDYDSTTTVSIHTFSESEHDVSAYVVDNARHVYMSDNALYITSTEYINEYEITLSVIEEEIEQYLSSDERDKIERIEQIDSDILSNREKEQKITQVYYTVIESLTEDEQNAFEKIIEDLTFEKLSEYEAMSYTNLKKFSYDGLTVEFEGDAQVAGYMDSQFAIDEHDDITRIATTIDSRYNVQTQEWDKSINRVSTLNSDLELLDSISLAEDERIYSVRFTDELVYVVTFKQIDPFFVIDVSDPSNIINLGELKIPGFSEYLHPYTDEYVIGVGYDVDAQTQRRGGIKISLFDVSDTSNPLEVSTYVAADRSRSELIYDHKAFMINPAREMMVIPVMINDWQETQNNFAGAYVFDLSNNQIELQGTVKHSKGTQDVWSSQVQRSLYIDDVLYTKSLYLLKMNDINTLNNIKDVDLITVDSDGLEEDYPTPVLPTEPVVR